VLQKVLTKFATFLLFFGKSLGMKELQGIGELSGLTKSSWPTGWAFPRGCYLFGGGSGMGNIKTESPLVKTPGGNDILGNTNGGKGTTRQR
jgi:hypothetical protein